MEDPRLVSEQVIAIDIGLGRFQGETRPVGLDLLLEIEFLQDAEINEIGYPRKCPGARSQT